MAASSSSQAPAFAGVPLLSQLPELPSTPAADPQRNPLDAFRLAIAAQIVDVVPDIPLANVFEGVQTSAKTGDFTVAMPRFKVPGKKPDELAKLVSEAFKPNAYVEKVDVKGGFLTYYVPTSTLIALTLTTIDEMTPGSSKETPSVKSQYGTNLTGKGKSAIVEFSSPNIAKPFHAGHLRSTIIGAFLANLFEANGWYIERWNYLGDWGKQFGLLAVGWGKYGSEEALKADAVKHLYDVYVKINADGEKDEEIHVQARAFFRRMEDGDEEAVALWRKFRDLSIEKYKETYARLNIHFDVYSGESQVSKESIQDAVQRLRSADYTERESNGALLVNLKQYKLEKAIVERADGTPLYITRDLGEAKKRWNLFQEKHGKGFDKMIYVVASQQDLHLAQFFKILDLMGYEWASKLQHINFGMVLGMSTRKGTAVFLDHILEEAKENMHDVMRKNDAKYALVEDKERTADVSGMTAVKIQDMSGKRGNNYNFDWARMLTFEGDTGPYLQYNHVRLCSVERRVAETDGVSLPTSPISAAAGSEGVKLDLLTEAKARDLVMLLASWPDIVKFATREMQPSTIVQFCFRLTHAVSSAWEVLLVKGQPRDVALARLFMYRCARNVLGAALRLLTIPPLERL